MVPTSVLVFCGLLLAVSVDPAWSASGPVIQQCPTHGEIAPCVCTVKKNGGLDILCEFTDLQHISKTMAVLKGKPSLVIFYLKLRHNNLPKLQGFVFLGMDIRHLTIHNSTLAVVEESSLSSIGKHELIMFYITDRPPKTTVKWTVVRIYNWRGFRTIISP